MNVLDLFSGIGGFSLGLERAGMRTVAFCEVEPFCRAILAKHWPGVPCYPDIRELTATRLAADGIRVDVICGGFPCQDVSLAGDRKGLDSDRSGLWGECARLIGELRPRFVLVENTTGLLSLGMGRVLGDLAALGFDAEWHCLPAAALGAPHVRDRVWIIAHSHEVRRNWSGRYLEPAHVVCDRSQWAAAPFNGWRDVVDWLNSPDAVSIWAPTDREDGRVDDGIRRGLDRDDIGALGNAVVPQIPEIIGRAIMRATVS